MQERNPVNGNLAVAEKQQRVIVIDAREKPQNIKLRVAAYARVSTDSEDQLNSFAAQNRYYTTLIGSKENWTMVDIYADCGLSGTSAKKRDEFQRLLSDCRKGRIDRVLCKSISRFARNSKECLEIIRELKSLGIGVCFEKGGINTATMSGEMLTAIFAAIAQSESESISGNMRWSYLQRMESGQFITCSAPFGYRLAGRELEICEPEAVLVRDIFRRYLAGDSVEKIAEYMNTLSVPTGEGTPYWQRTSIIYILTNEKYVGNALLQKRYTTETLPYQSKINHGERPKQSVLDMVPLYLSEGAAEGVRGDIAFAQSCLETGNFTFSGSAVTLDQNNFCGMGVTANGTKGNSFDTPQLGIRAQVQHLKAYASTEPLKGECIDPRFQYVARGCAEVAEWLGQKENPQGMGWATGAGYGEKIITILKAILAVVSTSELPQPEMDNTPAAWSKNAVEWCVSNGILQGGSGGDLMLRSPLTREQFCVMLKRYHDHFNTK